MFREDVFWLLPAVLIAVFQVKVLWGALPESLDEDTKRAGDYTDLDGVVFSYGRYSAYFLFWLQLVFPLLLITDDPGVMFLLRSAGYLLIVGGLLISSLALKDLGMNWSGMNEYRIKKGQELVSRGVYGWVRHPIYLAGILEIAGFELIADSWLAVILPAMAFWVVNGHVRKEDVLLEKEFGKKFVEYKRITKAFLPYIY